MDDAQLLRYSRHILLPELGIEAQQRFLASHVLIVGAGGLGSPAALFLAASGIGKLTLSDDDTVDLTNLQRQVMHRNAAVGKPKVISAKETLAEINPEIQVTTIQERLDESRMQQLVSTVDVVLDCSDNFDTRYALNRVCYAARKPLVSGAAIKFDGQVTVFDFRRNDSPCYNCLYPEPGESEQLRCALTGVFSPLVGIIGSIQAAETLKLLAGLDSLCCHLLLLNALDMRPRNLALYKDPGCTVCS